MVARKRINSLLSAIDKGKTKEYWEGQYSYRRRKKMLYLILKKHWFNKIKSGTKKSEYRRITPYWSKRLLNNDGSVKVFKKIHFRNGYRKDNPYMVVEWKGMNINRVSGFFEIKLGCILEKGF